MIFLGNCVQIFYEFSEFCVDLFAEGDAKAVVALELFWKISNCFCLCKCCGVIGVLVCISFFV